MSPKGEVETSFEQFSDLETNTTDTGFGNSEKQSFLLWTLSILTYLRTNRTIIIITIILLIKIHLQNELLSNWIIIVSNERKGILYIRYDKIDSPIEIRLFEVLLVRRNNLGVIWGCQLTRQAAYVAEILERRQTWQRNDWNFLAKLFLTQCPRDRFFLFSPIFLFISKHDCGWNINECVVSKSEFKIRNNCLNYKSNRNIIIILLV